MTEFNSFTEKANQSLDSAMKTAMSLGHIYIGSEHILCGLLAVKSGVAYRVLSKQGITENEVLQKIEKVVGKGIRTNLSVADFTPRTKRLLENALSEANLCRQNFAGTEHILRAMVKDLECYAALLLKDLGVHLGSLYNDCGGDTDKNKPIDLETGAKSGGALKKYGRELTEFAKNNKIDPVIGRNDEIERVIQVLLRRRKNNPCLIGESGVGKTAVAEGLALRIASGDVPDNIKNKRIFMLDLAAMLAGAKYRGDFEERIKDTLDDVVKDNNVILFIDEIHSIIGAGAAEGAIDAAGILKPMLARGELQLVGATTIDEYRKYIEKDAALERRFQPITVEEPDEEASVKILKGLKDKYEIHHKIKISDEAINAAVSLSARYIPDRFLPDKAIDLIDEASSKMRLKKFAAPPQIKEAEERIKRCENDKERAVNSQDFETAAKLRDECNELREKLNEIKLKWKLSDENILYENFENEKIIGTIGIDEISEIVSKWTGIPLNRLKEDEAQRLIEMEQNLRLRIIGQDEAVNAVTRAIKRGRAGLKNPARPIVSLIFLGPTGVGKTELCKALADIIFGSENALIRFDMSEYMEKHDVSKLIGSPPGYIGFEEGGQLTEKVRRKPYSVVLFDEIEKAHSDISNILLQIMEDGILTASDGRKVSFKNTVIIMTSNIGAKQITENKQALGFGASADTDTGKEKALRELKQAYKPEFINRADDIIVFNKLSESDISSICVNMLGVLSERAKLLGIDVTLEKSAVERLVKLGYDNKYGARPLRRAITAHIEDLLSQKIIEREITSGDKLYIKVENEEFEVVKV